MNPVMARAKRQAGDDERRRSQRAPIEIAIQYESVDELFSEFTRNINEGGLFVATERPLEIDETVQLSFRLPGTQEAIHALGRVARVETKEQGGVAGIGIEFEQLDDSARAAINRLVRSLRTEAR